MTLSVIVACLCAAAAIVAAGICIVNHVGARQGQDAVVAHAVEDERAHLGDDVGFDINPPLPPVVATPPLVDPAPTLREERITLPVTAAVSRGRRLLHRQCIEAYADHDFGKICPACRPMMLGRTPERAS